MCKTCRNISLGFVSDPVPEGTHMCLVFTTDAERVDSLLKFLLSGLADNDCVTCFSERITEDEVRDFLQEHGISYDERKAQQAVSISYTGDVYFEDGRFDPERMLKLLSDFYDTSLEMGYEGARVIGEMTPEVEHVPGGERLLEYESRVSLLVREKPVTAVCQYDARLFDGATIMEVLKVHPQMIVNGSVVRNPFFVEPRHYLSEMEQNG